jgi:uncharacterized 2Fe-2S/4Fe-4S cluster protein (DUF4445 family)
MRDTVEIQLLPLGRSLTVATGTSLQDALFAQGVEFPCGGRGRCKGCRVKVLEGDLPVTPEDERLLSAEERAEGWRLSCRAQAQGDLKIELAQWEANILADQRAFAFTPQSGLGAAVDLGTTTIVAQLLDRRTGNVLGVRLGLNHQAKHGADIMSRIDYAMQPGGQATLQRLVREQIGGLVVELLAEAPAGVPLEQVVVVGNTVMHHLFCGQSIEPLSHHPFDPPEDGLRTFAGSDLGWSTLGAPTVSFLPCLGGFVGSDILAGILATKLHESDRLVGLVDLGTNGEIVVGNRERLLCASTAAGPAFEGARISMGMRAATGAIAEVVIRDGVPDCRVLGHVAPRGICGSGLVDAVACGLDLGLVRPTGRLAQGDRWTLSAPVVLTQTDIRELQLAKGAIAAGIRLLLAQWGASLDDLTRLYLAGAFGNYISRASARRIGLLPCSPELVEPAGNTALLGAKLALFHLAGDGGEYQAVRQMTRHVSLNEDPHFHEIYVEEMQFPAPS